MLVQLAVCYPKTSNVSSPSRIARIELNIGAITLSTQNRRVGATCHRPLIMYRPLQQTFGCQRLGTTLEGVLAPGRGLAPRPERLPGGVPGRSPRRFPPAGDRYQNIRYVH